MLKELRSPSLIAVIALVAVANIDARAAGTEPTTATVVDSYVHSLVWTSKVVLRGTRIGEDISPPFEERPPLPRRSIEAYSVHKDGEHLRVRGTIRTTVGGQSTDSSYYTFQHVVGTGEDFDIQDQPKIPRSMMASTSRQHPMPQAVRYRYLGPLFGYMGGLDGETVANVLEDAQDIRLIPSAEAIDGVAVETLEAQTAYGVIRMSVGKEDGVARRIVLEKRPGDILNGTPLGKEDAIQGDTLTHWTGVLAEVEVSNIRGRVIPTGGKLTITVNTAAAEAPKISTATYQLTQVDLDPSFDKGSFRPILEEGTPISNRDDRSGVAYEWHDGKVVKRVDARVVGQIADIPAYPRATDSNSFWNDWKILLAGGLVLFVVALSSTIWVFRKGQSRDAQT